MYYAVTEGRARTLDRLDLRDRSTYGVDWIVLDAPSGRDALRQWRLFKAGTHPAQAELELEAARYQARAPGCVPAWEADRDMVSSAIARTVEAVDERRQELGRMQGELTQLRDALLETVPRRRRAGRRRRRAARPAGRRKTAPGARRRAA